MTLRVAELSLGECADAARLLGRAFRDNPMNVAILGRDAAFRASRTAAGVRAYLPQAMTHGRVLAAWQEAALAGVLIALPPGSVVLPPPDWCAWTRLLWAQGPRAVRRFGDVAETLQRHHPVEPHWTLATLGVEPSRQRSGVGRGLVTALVATIRREPAGIYLDTDRLENLDFYESQGFMPVGELEVEGVRVFRLWRPSGAGR